MSTTTIAVAQIQTHRENISKNIEKHMSFIELAAEQGSKFIQFPELSITGYEREQARAQCFEEADKRLDCFRKASEKHDIVIAAGAPLLLEDRLYIASWIFKPNGTQEIYIKKYLHTGEEIYFESSMQRDPVLRLNDKQLSFAICFDIENDAHIQCAKEKNSDYYAAGIFYSQEGIPSGLRRLQYIAKEYAIAVFMSNYTGVCYDMVAGGHSSIWSKNGELVIAADAVTECLLVAENTNEKWTGRIIKLR
jgi:predicted amidohydrolase